MQPTTAANRATAVLVPLIARRAPPEEIEAAIADLSTAERRAVLEALVFSLAADDGPAATLDLLDDIIGDLGR